MFPWKMMLSAVSWTAMFCLAVARTLLNQQALVVWVLVAGMLALVTTGWCLAEHIGEAMTAKALRHHEQAEAELVERIARRLAQALREDRLTSV